MRERGIHIRPPEPDESLRFHPRCPYGTDAYPCMLALVRNTLTDKPQAVVRTALSSCGEKIERMSYGPTGGGGHFGGGHLPGEKDTLRGVAPKTG